MSGRLENRTVLITGAASGIGRATVLLAIAEGARVAMIDQGCAGLESTVETARTAGGTVWSASIDITESGALASAIASLVQDLGPLDGDFANAGILPPPNRSKRSTPPSRIASWPST